MPSLSEAKKYTVESKHWTNKYDRYFRKYTKRYFGPSFDWKWFKAQGIAESGLKDSSKSHRNARGIMQIMPATFKEIKNKNPHYSNIHSPKWNIAAGIYYDKNLYRKIYNRWQYLSEGNRLNFMFASYNAGFGRILNTMKKVRSKKNKELWEKVKQLLPKETQNYVTRIQRLMNN